MPVRYSVIIPTLNEEKFLPKLLSSLAAQTDKNFEVIIVDGSSKDNTVAVAKRFTKKLPKFTVIVSKKANLPLQRNLGAAAAKSEWFIFVDADSILMPYFIERIGGYIAKYAPQLFTTWFRPDSEISGDAMLTLLANISSEGSIIIKRQHAPGPLTIVSQKAFNSVNGYDESRNYLEDYDLSWRLSKKGYRMQILRETLCVWSLRRLRKKGNLRFAQIYAQSVFSVLINKPFKNMPGYVMGGHSYDKKKKSAGRKAMQKFERNLKKLLNDIFE